MDTYNSIGSLVDLASHNVAVISAVAVVLIAFLVWKRTGSGHMFLARIWRIYVGKPDCHHAGIDNLLAEQVSIMKFRFMTGMKVRTLSQIEELISYSKKNHENISALAACGSYFDIESCSLKAPGKRGGISGLLALGTLAATLMFAIILAFAGMIPDRALLKIKRNEVYFFMDSKSANRMSLNPFVEPYARFDMRLCSNLSEQAIQETGFSVIDINDICQKAKDPDVGTYLREALNN